MKSEYNAGHHAGFINAINCPDIPNGEKEWGYNVFFFHGENYVAYALRSYPGIPDVGYVRFADSNGWVADWQKIVSANIPEVHELPLNIAGDINTSHYSRDQFGRVFVSIRVRPNTHWSETKTIGTMPEGFRPDWDIVVPALVQSYGNPFTRRTAIHYFDRCNHYSRRLFGRGYDLCSVDISSGDLTHKRECCEEIIVGGNCYTRLIGKINEQITICCCLDRHKPTRTLEDCRYFQIGSRAKTLWQCCQRCGHLKTLCCLSGNADDNNTFLESCSNDRSRQISSSLQQAAVHAPQVLHIERFLCTRPKTLASLHGEKYVFHLRQTQFAADCWNPMEEIRQ
ncbi:MAG: hypothetical protein ACLR4Z_18110 [Butyricicoccaceae bacterium]